MSMPSHDLLWLTKTALKDALMSIPTFHGVSEAMNALFCKEVCFILKGEIRLLRIIRYLRREPVLVRS